MTEIMASLKSVQGDPDIQRTTLRKKLTKNLTLYIWTPEAADFKFEKEMECLAFKLNLGKVLLQKEHRSRFVGLIYSNQQLFSLVIG